MSSVVWTFIKELYARFLRPILLKAIDDPEAEWDDWLMKIADNIFEYNGR